MPDASQLVSEGFRAFNERGVTAFLDYLERMDALDEGFEMEIQADAPNGGVWRGREGLEEMARLWLEAWEEFEVLPEDPIELAPGRLLVPARQRIVARGSGIELEERFFYTVELADRRFRRLGLFVERSLAERHLGVVEAGS
jgi:hypothetical protein